MEFKHMDIQDKLVVKSDYVRYITSAYESLQKSFLVIQLIFFQDQPLTRTRVLDSMVVAFLQDLTHTIVEDFDLVDGKVTLQHKNETTTNTYVVALRAVDMVKHFASANWLRLLQTPSVLKRIGTVTKALCYFSHSTKIFTPSFNMRCKIDDIVVRRGPQKIQFREKGYLYRMDRIYGEYGKLGYDLDLRISDVTLSDDNKCETEIVAVTEKCTYLWCTRKIKSTGIDLIKRWKSPPELFQCLNQRWFCLKGSDESDVYVSKGVSITEIMDDLLNIDTRFRCIQSMCNHEDDIISQVCKIRFNNTRPIINMDIQELHTCIEWQKKMCLTGTTVVPYYTGAEYGTLTLDEVIMLVSRTMLHTCFIEDGMIEALKRSMNNKYTHHTGNYTK